MDESRLPEFKRSPNRIPKANAVRQRVVDAVRSAPDLSPAEAKQAEAFLSAVATNPRLASTDDWANNELRTPAEIVSHFGRLAGRAGQFDKLAEAVRRSDIADIFETHGGSAKAAAIALDRLRIDHRTDETGVMWARYANPDTGVVAMKQIREYTAAAVLDAVARLKHEAVSRDAESRSRRDTERRINEE